MFRFIDIIFRERILRLSILTINTLNRYHFKMKSNLCLIDWTASIAAIIPDY